MVTLKERYKNLKTLVVERKEPFTRLMHHLETETAWLTAPASTRFHLCREEGLLEHSINVAETMLKLKDTLAPDITDESCVIVAMLHDLVYLSVPVRSLYLALPGAAGWQEAE